MLEGGLPGPAANIAPCPAGRAGIGGRRAGCHGYCGPATAAAKTYTITDLGSLGLGESVPYGINATGQVTGYSVLSQTYTIPAITRARPSARPTPTTRSCTATARCRRLRLPGPRDQQHRPDRRHPRGRQRQRPPGAGSNGTVTDLGSVGSIGDLANVEALSMNNNGQIAGNAATGTAFVYSNGTITNLTTFFPGAISDNA